MSKTASKATAAALALALLAAACSGESDLTTTAGTTPSTESAASADSTSNDAAASAQPDDGDSAVAEPVAKSQVWLAPEEAEAAAQQNIGSLQPADDVRNIQVLSVASGGISSLQEAVTGDRPVLLWFYAPH